KSYMVQQLAGTLARIGHKVLVVDGNLFAPTLTQRMASNDKLGLIEVLKGIYDKSNATSVQECIYSTEEENLYILPKGGDGEEIAYEKWVRSEYLRTIVEELRPSFDYVLVEVPSFECLSYTQNITATMDGCILVLGSGELEVSKAAAVHEQIETLGCEMLSCMFNKKTDISYNLPKEKKSLKRKERRSKAAPVEVGEGVSL
ncbi:MAG: AAA family ATPase, partial [Niameybacter sp.]